MFLKDILNDLLVSGNTLNFKNRSMLVWFETQNYLSRKYVVIESTTDSINVDHLLCMRHYVRIVSLFPSLCI